jgi:hypothetical protein
MFYMCVQGRVETLFFTELRDDFVLIELEENHMKISPRCF